MSAGKGSAQRPTDMRRYRSGWDEVFRKARRGTDGEQFAQCSKQRACDLPGARCHCVDCAQERADYEEAKNECRMTAR